MLFLLLLFFESSEATTSCPLQPVNAGGKGIYKMCIPNKSRSFGIGDEIRIGGVNSSTAQYALQFNLFSSTSVLLLHLSIQSSCKANTRIRSESKDAKGRWSGIAETYPFVPKQFVGNNVWHRIKNTPEGITLEIDFWEWNENICPETPYLHKHLFKHRTPNPDTDYKIFEIAKPTTMQFGAVVYYSEASHSHEEIPFNNIPLWTNFFFQFFS